MEEIQVCEPWNLATGKTAKRSGKKRRPPRSGTRQDAFEFWGPDCAYCGEAANTLDHVHARADGGYHAAGNLVPACESCNNAKDDLPLEVFLRRDPGRLAWITRRLVLAQEIQDRTRDLHSADYWANKEVYWPDARFQESDEHG